MIFPVFKVHDVKTQINCFSQTDVICNLGILLDSKCSFPNYVNSLIQSCLAILRDSHRIRYFLIFDVLVMVANVLVSSHLYYCNSLFHSFHPKYHKAPEYAKLFGMLYYWWFQIYLKHQPTSLFTA